MENIPSIAHQEEGQNENLGSSGTAQSSPAIEGVSNEPNMSAVTEGVSPTFPGISPRVEINQVLATSSSLEDIPPPKADYYAPPPYEVATQTTKLPTYEEVQREKHLEDELLGIPIVNDPLQFRTPPAQRILLPIDNEAAEDVDTSLLGTDFMFYIAFFVAFIFNWIGFLLLMCFCHTIASRYGALSGFGLSLAKWTFIVQHSTELASKDNSWLWWLIMTFGLIICIRAILQYLNIKRGWHMLSASHQERNEHFDFFLTFIDGWLAHKEGTMGSFIIYSLLTYRIPPQSFWYSKVFIILENILLACYVKDFLSYRVFADESANFHQ